MGYKQYCKDYENIENYDKAKVDNFVGWDCHHRLETHNSDGVRRLIDISAAELKALDMYYNRPSSKKINNNTLVKVLGRYYSKTATFCHPSFVLVVLAEHFVEDNLLPVFQPINYLLAVAD